MKYFIANWKANKNLEEMQFWVKNFIEYLNSKLGVKQKLENGKISVIICPPFPLVYPLKQSLQSYKNIFVGCQDISKIEGGTFTGEVPAHSLTSLVTYAIIGHSERKKFLNETDEEVNRKYFIAKHIGIEPIYCIAGTDHTYPKTLNFICYEPPEAISRGDGRGDFESSANILAAKQTLKVPSTMKFIYGGSVNRDNISEYLAHDEIDGFLVGGASLDPQHFFDIIGSSV